MQGKGFFNEQFNYDPNERIGKWYLLYLATVNWAAGPYFIQTETNPTGGTNYTINSTTQLLSVLQPEPMVPEEQN